MFNNTIDRTKPFLKWAGGKRWFVQKHADLFPDTYNRYIEPFLGSGAVFFYLQPQQAILGDLCSDLVDTYLEIKRNWRLVYRYLREHHKNHSHDYYYLIRSTEFNSKAKNAAKFIYLNRTCWNGLYRVNMKGIFNVPIGTKKSVLFENDDFAGISALLQHAKIINSDFEDLIDLAGESDLVFVDPPYTVRHNYNAFIKYNEKLFKWYDQERLFYALKRARNRGAHIVGTNAYHKSIRELYGQTFNSFKTLRNSPISSKASTRKQFEELVIFSG